MARMNGLMETLVHNQSPPPLLTEAEHANLLRARRRADDAAADLRAADDVNTTPDEGSSEGGLAHEAHLSRRRRTAPAQKTTTRPGGP